MTEHDRDERPDDVLAAEYVLGVLTADERGRFAARLETEPALKDKVRFWTEQLAPMADAVDPVTPPQTAFAGIEERLFPAQQPASGWWSSLPLWRGLAITSIAALVAVGIYLVSLPGLPDQDGRNYVAQISGDADAVQLVAYIDADRKRLTLSRTDGAPQEGRDFELWLIEGDNSPVSLGVLPADTVTTLAVPDGVGERLAGAVLAISDEPLGGSPTGQPTGAVLATGAIVEI